jgi:hypothetical protein
MIMINYFQIDNEKFVKIVNDEMGNHKHNTMCFDVSNGDMVLVDDMENVFLCVDKNDNHINLFDLMNKQDIYVNDKYYDNKIMDNKDGQ